MREEKNIDKITGEDLLAIAPSSVGLELETNRELAETLHPQLRRFLDFSMHSESSRILEVNLKPAFTESIVDVMLTGEFIRRCNPFHWIGGGDPASGSAHCHVNPPSLDAIANEIELGSLKKITRYNDSTDALRCLQSSRKKLINSANLFWNHGVQAGLLPFLSLGYLKRDNSYTFRDKIRYITQKEILKFGRGTGMGINREVSYGEYGLEYRANENTPLWVYILPLLALHTNRDTEFGKLLFSLRDKYSDVSSMYNTNITVHTDAITYVLEKIRPYLLDNIELMSLQVKEVERPIFMEIMEAYITEDVDRYDAILEQVLKRAEGAAQVFQSIDSVIKTDKVARYITSASSNFSSDKAFNEYLTAVHKDFKKPQQ